MPVEPTYQTNLPKDLWAQQDKLSNFSAGFGFNDTHVGSFENQLTPSQKTAVSKENEAK